MALPVAAALLAVPALPYLGALAVGTAVGGAFAYAIKSDDPIRDGVDYLNEVYDSMFGDDVDDWLALDTSTGAKGYKLPKPVAPDSDAIDIAAYNSFVLAKDNVEKVSRSVNKNVFDTSAYIEKEISKVADPVRVDEVVSPDEFNKSQSDLGKRDGSLTLIDAISNASTVQSRLIAEQNQILNVIAVALQGQVQISKESSSVSNTNAVLATTMLSKIAEGVNTGLSTSTGSGTASVNVTNEIDLSPLTESVSALGALINTPERARFHKKSADLADYRTKTQELTDIDGKDAILATPEQVRTMKDVAKARGEADENDFSLDDDIFNTFPDLSMIGELFKFKGLFSDINKFNE